MNDRQIVEAPGGSQNRGWVEAYMPDGSLQHQQPAQRLIDLAMIRGIIFRQRWLIAFVLSFCLVGGLVVTLLSTPMYEASSTIRVEAQGRYIVEGQDIEIGVAPNQVFDYMETQIAVIESRNLAGLVAENLNLAERTAVLGADFDASRPPGLSDDEWLRTKRDQAAVILQSNVSAAAPDGNWIIEISYSSADPVLASELANGYADVFAASDTRESVETNEYAQGYLLEQIDLLRARLEDAEKAVNTYARQQQIIVEAGSAEGVSPNTLNSSNLTAVNSRASQARAKRIEAEQRWLAVRNLPPSQLPEVQSSTVLQGLIAQRVGLESQRAELMGRYSDEYPPIRDIVSQINVLNDQIERTAAEIKSTIKSEYTVALSQEQGLQAELANLTSVTLSEQDAQVELSVLEREAEALREQLAVLLQRYNSISSAAKVDSGSFMKLDNAVVPNSPYSPDLFKNMMLALVVGTAIAGAIALVRETFDDRLRSLEEVEQKLGLALIGQTPHIDEADIEIDKSNFNALMESYASIRSTIDFVIPRDRNVLQFTSTEPAEGKSTSAVILAELFARLGRKTLLIDADLRRPSISKLLDLDGPKVGLAEVILGHAKMEDAIITGEHPNLDILPVAGIPPNPSDLLSSEALKQILERCSKEYSLVLIDSPPVLGLADAVILSNVVDGTVFVMEANRIRFNKANAALRRLLANGANPLGVILTKYRALEAGDDYRDQYGYYQYGSD